MNLSATGSFFLPLLLWTSLLLIGSSSAETKCPKPVALINGDFEHPPVGPTYSLVKQDEVPGWQTTASDEYIELWHSGFQNVEAKSGNQFAELNANEASTLYQDIPTTPGTTLYWQLSHRGTRGVDTMGLYIGDPSDPVEQGRMTDGKDKWGTYTGKYVVPPGQTTTRFAFRAISSSTGNPGVGNLLDDISFGSAPCVEVVKTATPKGPVKVGDIITYNIDVTNRGGKASSVVIEDVIPQEAEYVPGTLKIDVGGVSKQLTDTADNDEGSVTSDRVIVNIGTMESDFEGTNPTTVSFQVKATTGGVTIRNVATVKYDNPFEVTSTPITVDSEPVETAVLDPRKCLNAISLVNGDFEEPTISSEWVLLKPPAVPGWKTTTPDGFIELWKSGFKGVKAKSGKQLAELNKRMPLYQDLPTTPGMTLYWELSHRGRLGVDTMALYIGSPSNPVDQGRMTDGKDKWGTYKGKYVVPSGQTTTRFLLRGISSATGQDGIGNLIDKISFGTAPCIEVVKTSTPKGPVNVGDVITYNIDVTNRGGEAASVVVEDVLPEGTEYVPGTLKVDAGGVTKLLTDAADNDEGSVSRDRVIVNIGTMASDFDGTKSTTVSFKVKATTGGVMIRNVATVKYENPFEATQAPTTVQSEPVETAVLPPGECSNAISITNGDFEEPTISSDWVLLKPPAVPGWKTTTSNGVIELWKSGFNGVKAKSGKQLAELNQNMPLYQDLPTTPGTTLYWQLSHRGRYGVDTMGLYIGSPSSPLEQSRMKDNKNRWGTYKGKYVVPPGQTTTRFLLRGISSSTGKVGAGNLIDDIFFGTGPCVEVVKTFTPKGPVEVGDIITYNIDVTNRGGQASSVVIEDVIPQEAEYVPGTLKVDFGISKQLTDAADNDGGSVSGGRVVVNIGMMESNFEGTKPTTVSFQVKATAGGVTIRNVASVKYENPFEVTATPTTIESEPVETVVLNPRECPKPTSLTNGDFEEPTIGPGYSLVNQQEVPGWKTTASDGLIELWQSGFQNVEAKSGKQFAELNAVEASTLYQDVPTTPGTTLYWQLSHRGTRGVDTMGLYIGDPSNLVEQGRMTDDNDKWGTYTGKYVVPPGQTTTRFAFRAISSSTGNPGVGNLLDDISFGTAPCVEVVKTATPNGPVNVGDIITYNIDVTNRGGDASSVVVEDVIPQEVEYVPGTLKVDADGISKQLTDAADNDEGSVSGGRVVVNIGAMASDFDGTKSTTVSFKVKATVGGVTVRNVATVKYENPFEATSAPTTAESEPVETAVLPPCPETISIINGDFEEPTIASDWVLLKPPAVPGWKTTTTNGFIELWKSGFNGVKAKSGKQLAELNQNMPLYQDLPTTPGTTLYWELSHRGRHGVDTMGLYIGSPSNPLEQSRMKDNKNRWGTYKGKYVVPPGQTTTRFLLRGISSSTGEVGAGNLIDDISFGTAPCEAVTTATPKR